MLPTYPCVVDQDGNQSDAYDDETWLPESQRALLRDGRAFGRELGSRSSVPTVSIFGYGFKTVTRLRMKRDRSGRWKNLDFISEPIGDSTVPSESAVLEGSEIHPVQQQHGAL